MPPPDRLDRRGRSRRHREPEAEPEHGEREGDFGRPTSWASSRTSPQRDDQGSRPTSVTARSDSSRTTKPDSERPDRRCAGERPECDALLIRPAVEHAVDEYRAADDRRREAVAGEQPRRAPPSRTPRFGTAAGRGTGPARGARSRSTAAGDDGDRDQHAGRPAGRGQPRGRSVVEERQRRRARPSRNAENSTAPTRSTRPARRGVSQPRSPPTRRRTPRCRSAR